MSARRIGIVAVSIAIVFVLVRFIQVPIMATGGFTHPGAVGEVFVSLAFGPVVGMIAAGVGAALADLTSGFAHFAPLTLLAHGALGFLTGFLGWRAGWRRMVAGWLVGGLAMIAIYLLGESAIPDLYGGFARALTEVGFNLFQAALGVLGLLLFRLVKRAYPPVDRMGEEVSFEEL